MDDPATRTLTITPGGQRHSYLLNHGREPVGSLRLAPTRTTQGEIRVPAGTWPVIRDPRDRHRVDAGDPDAPLVALRDGEATVAGDPAALPWSVAGRFVHLSGRLGTGERAIAVDCSGWRGAHATVSVAGTWEHEALVVLTCFFGLLARRRRAITLLVT